MAFEVVSISVGGIVLQPVTFGMTLAHDEAARAFEAKVKHADLSQADLLSLLASAPACTIRTTAGSEPAAPRGSDLVLTGNVEKRSPRLAGEEKELTISGRSKTGDLVDSSAEHKTGEFRKKTARDVIGELAEAHGVKVEAETTLKSRDLFRLYPGETVFAAAERWARAEGFTLSDTPEGNLKIAAGATKQHAGEIADGDGWPAIIDASAVHDDSKRFGKVKVRAQAPDGYGPDTLQIEDEARDEAPLRGRVRVITPPEQVAKTDARKRAQWHRDRAAGEGVSCEVTVVGWRDAAGRIWTPGWNVFVAIADLGLSQPMTIKTVKLAQSDEGTKATLSLVDPRAFGAKSAKGGKSGKGWNMGKSGGDDT
jgi:prophage tail gpP-like protein